MPSARDLVATALTAGSCAPATVEIAQLLVSELATNVVVHARTEVFTVEIDIVGNVLVVGVHDDDTGEISTGPMPPADAPGGRGLVLLEELATRWWFATRADGRGKVVYFELTLP